MSNLSQLLQQVIMNGTPPTTTITSDGNGNNKESTKIVWDGGMPERGELGERLSDYDYPTAAQWGGTTFGQPTGNAEAISNGFGNMWDGVSGAMNDFTQSPTGSAISESVGGAVDWWKSIDPPKAWDADHTGVDANGNPYYPAHNYRPGPNGDGDGPTKGGLGRKVDYAKKQNPVDPSDPNNILGGGTPPATEDQAKLDAEKKAAIKEKFKNVKGGDYSVKAVEESAEQAGQEYQDDLLSRYGDYDFAVQAANERKARLKRTNQVVMQGFMLDVMSQALGKKVGSQNYVENALKALEIDFEIGNADKLQEVTKALYFRPDGTYDPPASKDEAFQALTMMGLTSTEAATISGKVSESQEYYIQDTSNPSGYRVVRKRPTGDTEYTTNASVANNKWGIDVNATSQTAAERQKQETDALKQHQLEYPRPDGFMLPDTADRLRDSVTNRTDTIDADFLPAVNELGFFGVISLKKMIRTGKISKNNVLGFGSLDEAQAYSNNVPQGTLYAGLYTDADGRNRIQYFPGNG